MNCRLRGFRVVPFLVCPISGSSWEAKVGGASSRPLPHVVLMSNDCTPRDSTRIRPGPNICALSPDEVEYLRPNGESWNRLWWNSLSIIGLSTRHVFAHRLVVDFSHFLSAVSINGRRRGSIPVPMASVRRTILENGSSRVLSCLLHSVHHSQTHRRTSKWPRKTLRPA
jgi:hypothetical protein